MYFFLAVCVAAVFMANVRPGWLRTQDFAMMGAVAALCIMGLVDHMRR